VPADDAVAWANALEAASAQPTVTLTRPAEFPADWVEFRKRVF
jgi:hypothetical protein